MAFNDLRGLLLGNGRYEIIEMLGFGGMGVVWEAQDSDLHRRVAIKTIQPAFNWQPEAVDTFVKEAHTIANLEHPYILGVYDLGAEPYGNERLVPFQGGFDACHSERPLGAKNLPLR